MVGLKFMSTNIPLFGVILAPGESQEGVSQQLSRKWALKRAGVMGWPEQRGFFVHPLACPSLCSYLI